MIEEPAPTGCAVWLVIILGAVVLVGLIGVAILGAVVAIRHGLGGE